ncbi:MAG: hypothetical protein IK115_03910 [Lachnospiraceae bacterium]|nr:hypothetical protein [Lachnospiraceae bacterium]
MSRGLVIVYDPHNLQQFLWYYATYAKDVQWDALCLPNGYKGTYMDAYCKKVGIFSNIFTGDKEYMSMPLSGKFKLFLDMFWHFITFRREKYCKKVLNEYVGDVDVYDELACICDTGFVSGLLALLGKHKTVSYFDDGLGEYFPRPKWSSRYLKSFSLKLQSVLLARMGYSCKGRIYFEPTKYCCKYSVFSDKMIYRNYKLMRDIDFSKTDMGLYDSLIEKAYPGLSEYDWDNIDVVFFTEDLDTYSSENYKKYGALCADYISRKYPGKSVLLKKHPKDRCDYTFDESISVTELDSEIPAEIILSHLQGKKIVFVCFSSIILFMLSYGYEYELLHMNELHQESIRPDKSAVHYSSSEEMKAKCERFSPGKYEIIEI